MRDRFANHQALSISIAQEQIASKRMMHRAMHGILTLMMLWPSYVFLDNTPTFDPAVKGYRWMSSVMTEHHWGWCCLFPAVVGVITFFVRSWKLRMVGAGVLSAAHAALALAVFLGNPDALLFGFLFGFALSGLALAYSTANTGARFANSLEGPRH